MHTSESPQGAAPIDPTPGADEAFFEDPERRRRLEDLARQLTGDRPRFRVLERLRSLLRGRGP